ncbi:TIGR04222 domain-containing membrane protein [Streptomyces sparsogenes]|uniref:TIGR04222 domain-containing membrane protein n=1 Tax=Streptomyces sparsogenes TaxID=67365 RepID=UPI0034026761
MQAVWAYVVFAASSAVLITGTVRARRAGGPVADARAHDLLEAAFLEAGPGRVADTVICAMHADGRLAVGGPGVVSVRQPIARDPVEHALLEVHAQAPHGGLALLRSQLMRHRAVQAIGYRLAERGLLVLPEKINFWRRLAAVQTVAAVAGVFLGIWGTSVEESGGYDGGVPLIFRMFPALFGAFLIGVICAASNRKRITAAGKRALRAYREDLAYATAEPRGGTPPRTGARVASVAEIVALTGVGALAADELLRDQLLEAHRTQAAAAASAGSSASSGSSGSSGSSSSCGTSGSWCGTSGSGSGCGSSSCGGGGGSSCGGGGSSCGGGSGCGGGGGCGGGCGGG